MSSAVRLLDRTCELSTAKATTTVALPDTIAKLKVVKKNISRLRVVHDVNINNIKWQTTVRFAIHPDAGASAESVL